MDDQTFLSDPIDVEVARRLAAFAEARLTPSLEATARMRDAVMQAAQRQLAVPEAGRSETVQDATPAARNMVRPRTVWQTWRRPMVAVLVGCLLVGVAAGTAWSARPGGAMYGVRLWAEMATLPTQPVERARAEVVRLQSRIDEAQQAAANGDQPAVEAALLAYSTIVIEAARGAAGDPEASATIEVSVERHLVVLTRIADAEPAGPARTAAMRALADGTRVVDDLRSPGGSVDPPSNQGGRPTDANPDADDAAHGTGAAARDGNGQATTAADRGRSQDGTAASHAAGAETDGGRTTKATREDKAPRGGGATPAPPTAAPGHVGGGSAHAPTSKASDCAGCPESKP